MRARPDPPSCSPCRLWVPRKPPRADRALHHVARLPRARRRRRGPAAGPSPRHAAPSTPAGLRHAPARHGTRRAARSPAGARAAAARRPRPFNMAPQRHATPRRRPAPAPPRLTTGTAPASSRPRQRAAACGNERPLLPFETLRLEGETDAKSWTFHLTQDEAASGASLALGYQERGRGHARGFAPADRDQRRDRRRHTDLLAERHQAHDRMPIRPGLLRGGTEHHPRWRPSSATAPTAPSRPPTSSGPTLDSAIHQARLRRRCDQDPAQPRRPAGGRRRQHGRHDDPGRCAQDLPPRNPRPPAAPRADGGPARALCPSGDPGGGIRSRPFPRRHDQGGHGPGRRIARHGGGHAGCSLVAAADHDDAGARIPGLDPRRLRTDLAGPRHRHRHRRRASRQHRQCRARHSRHGRMALAGDPDRLRRSILPLCRSGRADAGILRAPPEGAISPSTCLRISTRPNTARRSCISMRPIPPPSGRAATSTCSSTA